ncbi:hypothetical protein V6N12_020245 [Hibiscus sabdariffa]|uniref:Uncharacterized protein n=1 Tax=Hibiscus sabdariffa TaxID=183260 RepID=A0ABR2BNI1_9ROSI
MTRRWADVIWASIEPDLEHVRSFHGVDGSAHNLIWFGSEAQQVRSRVQFKAGLGSIHRLGVITELSDRASQTGLDIYKVGLIDGFLPGLIGQPNTKGFPELTSCQRKPKRN